MSSRTELLAPIVSIIDCEYDPERPESIWKLESALRDMSRVGAPTAALNQELRAILADPNYEGEWRLNRVVLYRGKGIALSIRLLQEPPLYIHSVPSKAMYVPLGKDPLVYDLYRLPARYDNQVFDPTLKLEPMGSAETPSGDVLRTRSDDVIHDFRIDRPRLILQLNTAPIQPLEWLFNRDSLLAWQANDSSLVSSQLRVAAYVLGKFAHQSSLEPLSELASHPHHSVRWAAIQGLGRISRSVAIDKLTAAVRDPHPHVRRAAAKALQQIQQPKTR